jgi:hypothetical protein
VSFSVSKRRRVSARVLRLDQAKSAIRGTIAVVHERLQVQAGPHLQASPHAQPVFADSALGLWHPHWQAAPGQDLPEHWVELDIGWFSFRSVDFLSTE